MDARQHRAYSTIRRIAANMVRGLYHEAVERGTIDQKTVSIARLGRLIERDSDVMRSDGADLADALNVLADELDQRREHMQRGIEPGRPTGGEA